MNRLRIDPVLLLAVFSVVAAGIFTLYTQEVDGLGNENRALKQSIFFGIGLILMIVLRRLNYDLLGNIAVPLYMFSIALLILTYLIGSEIKGAKSWIRFGPVGFQTSELAKLSTIILLAKYLELKERELEHITSLLIPFTIAVVPMLLIVNQPDLGGAFIFAPILLAMLFIASADAYHLSSIIVFFGITLSLPLYIEYHNIMLVDPLITRLSELGQQNLLPAVRILGSDIWSFVEDSKVPAGVAGSDADYLQNVLSNAALMANLEEASESVRGEIGGIFLRMIDNDYLIIGLGGVLSAVALGLLVWRLTQGVSFAHLRKYYIPLGVIGVALLSAAAVHKTFSFKYHQVVRVTAFLNPDRFPRDLAYQIRASKAAIGSGQWAGRGLFKGEMTLGDRPVVPEAFTDFIFTSWSERTGLFGSFLLLLALVAIPIRAVQISFEARDRFGSLLAAGIGFYFFFHIFLNVGISLGLLPVTGLPLSFMSYGGSHLIMCMSAVGILLSVYRRRHAN